MNQKDIHEYFRRAGKWSSADPLAHRLLDMHEKAVALQSAFGFGPQQVERAIGEAYVTLFDLLAVTGPAMIMDQLRDATQPTTAALYDLVGCMINATHALRTGGKQAPIKFAEHVIKWHRCVLGCLYAEAKQGDEIAKAYIKACMEKVYRSLPDAEMVAPRGAPKEKAVVPF